MKLENLFLDMKNTYGELRFFGLEKENMVYDTVTKQRTSQLDSRVYKVLSMDQGEMIEVLIPASVTSDVITLDKNTVVELVNPKLSVTGSVVTKGKFNTVDLKPLLKSDNILLAGTGKQSTKS